MGSEADDRRRAYVAKARAELGALDEEGVLMSGNAFSQVMLLKGSLSSDEATGAALLSGPDGVALRKALCALGYGPEDWVALATCGKGGSAALAPETLRRAIVTADPATVVACDDAAAAALREAYADDLVVLDDFEEAMLAPGRVVHIRGMRVINLGDFAASLSDDHEKQVMWARLKRIGPLGEPF